ncbi:hypothetical protein [Synechocystis salina]|uniref:Uncharacterized protein n=1 Tax=Synechocystis salina LEGE 00031 TaxID=1828736 RepID=A0ABR9VS57_9SYNC|nr:hypothetical protein [Synechocystis salina]MBE9240780.1 hypothetical protein [Synechocystis salina LEGE 00041]MBE9254187.1 hypothetical protein [Synechocystis salina LEGE 00031]
MCFQSLQCQVNFSTFDYGKNTSEALFVPPRENYAIAIYKGVVFGITAIGIAIWLWW